MNRLPILTGHTSGVSSVAFSPDGQLLVSASGDGTIRLWNVADGTLARRIRASATVVAFSPNGEFLASGDWDGTIRVWRTSNWTLVYSFRAHSEWLNSLTFSPDGQLLASGGFDWVWDDEAGFGYYSGTVRLWNVSDGTLVHTFEVPAEVGVFSVIFSPDGRYLASASGDDIIRFWQVLDRILARYYDQETLGVIPVQFSPNGRFFAYGRKDATVVLARNPFASQVEGDVNGDGCVDDADLLAVLFAFGSSGSGLPEDVNNDGMVDDADLLIVLFNFGSGC